MPTDQVQPSPCPRLLMTIAHTSGPADPHSKTESALFLKHRAELLASLSLIPCSPCGVRNFLPYLIFLLCLTSHPALSLGPVLHVLYPEKENQPHGRIFSAVACLLPLESYRFIVIFKSVHSALPDSGTSHPPPHSSPSDLSFQTPPIPQAVHGKLCSGLTLAGLGKRGPGQLSLTLDFCLVNAWRSTQLLGEQEGLLDSVVSYRDDFRFTLFFLITLVKQAIRGLTDKPLRFLQI